MESSCREHFVLYCKGKKKPVSKYLKILIQLKYSFKITGGDNSLTEDKKEGLFGSVSYGIVIV